MAEWAVTPRPEGIVPVKLRRFVCLALLAVAACAPAQVPWSNPALPRDRWSSDWSACKREAEVASGWHEDTGNSGSPFRDFDRVRAKKMIDPAVAQCMSDLGYQPVRKGE